jgi:O-antigen/teichoic acid export membrane protein
MSFALGVTVIFNTALFRVDTVLLSLFKGNGQVGLYGVAYRLLESTLFISYGFVSALLPSLSRLSRSSRPTIGEATELGLKVIVAGLLPLGTAFALLAEPIVDLVYSARYDPAVPAVRLLGGAAALYGIGYLAANVLIGQGRQRVLPWVTAAVLIFNVAANLLLIPRWSFKGAALVTSLSEACLAAGLMTFVLRRTGRLSARRIVTGPLVGCLAVAALRLALGEGLVALFAAPPVYLLVLLAVERRMFPADIRRLTEIIRRRSPLLEAGT